MWIKDHGRLFELDIPSRFKLVYQPIKGLSLFAAVPFSEGDLVLSLSGHVVEASGEVSPEAVQIDEEHFLDGYDYVPEDFLNHGCDPNLRLDLESLGAFALRAIEPDEELFFHYLTTEWDLVEQGCDFQCLCGSGHCLGHVRGFRYLTHEQQLSLEPLLSPFLRSRMV